MPFMLAVVKYIDSMWARSFGDKGMGFFASLGLLIQSFSPIIGNLLVKHR